MSTAAEVQTLLRFLSQDAKIPLSNALSKIKALQAASLTNPSLIAKSNVEVIQGIFSDEKLAKQILGAAKRVTKKRSSTDSPNASCKRTKLLPADDTPAAIEESLRLPHVVTTETDLSTTILYTNRAPLVLAFAVTLLQYTMPAQPLSSRLSLAQALVSANSRSKAVSLGLEGSVEEGWGRGQSTVRVMGREIPVLKRWAYESSEHEGDMEGEESKESANDPVMRAPKTSEGPPLWGLDLEVLRSSNTRAPGCNPSTSRTSLPIHTAESAHAYLLKSFATAPSPDEKSSASTTNSSTSKPTSPSSKKPSAPKPTSPSHKVHNLALLLQALDMLHASWAPVLSPDELDRRSWGWYVAVRPEVKGGVAGWGGKGEVRLGEILDLRR